MRIHLAIAPLQTTQPPIAPLKNFAIEDMFRTLETFHRPMDWLKDMALLNMSDMSVTLDTSQDPISWLKELASLNMPDMSNTLGSKQVWRVAASATAFN
jgi:hypothetical protein